MQKSNVLQPYINKIKLNKNISSNYTIRISLGNEPTIKIENEYTKCTIYKDLNYWRCDIRSRFGFRKSKGLYVFKLLKPEKCLSAPMPLKREYGVTFDEAFNKLYNDVRFNCFWTLKNELPI